MFKVGNYVVYGNTGICKIEDIASMDIMGTGHEKKYYVLIPVNSDNGKAYLPVDNQKVVLRAVISRDEAVALIDRIPEIENITENNDKLREERYKQLSKQCSCESWVAILKTIYQRKKEREALGKKSTSTDERYFKMAEDKLYEELCFAMELDKPGVEEYIKTRIE